MKSKMDPREIIESSKSLFGTHGFKKVTMTDIATAAKISRPTLYSFYPDKESVFSACILSHIVDFKSESKEKRRGLASPVAKLKAHFKIYIVKPYEWYFESEAFDMLVHANDYAPNEMSLYWKDFEDGIREILAPDAKSRVAVKDAARVLVGFARDTRQSAKNVRELERLIDAAIGMALS